MMKNIIGFGFHTNQSECVEKKIIFQLKDCDINIKLFVRNL